MANGRSDIKGATPLIFAIVLHGLDVCKTKEFAVLEAEEVVMGPMSMCIWI